MLSKLVVTEYKYSSDEDKAVLRRFFIVVWYLFLEDIDYEEL